METGDVSFLYNTVILFGLLTVVFLFTLHFGRVYWNKLSNEIIFFGQSKYLQKFIKLDPNFAE